MAEEVKLRRVFAGKRVRMAVDEEEDSAGTMQSHIAAVPHEPQHSGSLQKAMGFRVDQVPPCLLHLCLALQQVLVQSSLLVLVIGLLQQQLWLQTGERERLLAMAFFLSGICTILHVWLGTRLPLIQTPSLEFIIPALVLTSKTVTVTQVNETCRESCVERNWSLTSTDPIRELQGMALVSGLMQLVLGASGLSSVVLRHCGPLVLAPLFCVLGFSIYREAALLCSDHWGIAALAIALIVFLSQHLHSWFLPFVLGTMRYPLCRMVSVLLPLLSIWGVCAVLESLGVLHPRSAPGLLSTLLSSNASNSLPWTSVKTSSSLYWSGQNDTSVTSWTVQNTSHAISWFHLPLTEQTRFPLLSTQGIAAGVAAALSSFISSLGIYLLTARLLRIPPPPAAACNRGLCAEGLGSVGAALLGAPFGFSSSIPNACTLELSQCGSRATVLLAAVIALILGLSPRMAQLLTSFPLSIHGAVLSVTYVVAMGTGVTYFQYTHMDSGRNTFNTGFAVFMSLLLPRWFNSHHTFIVTGVSSLDVLLQSLLTLPVFIVGLLAFFLDNTVSGSLSERGLSSTAVKKRVLDEMQFYHLKEHTVVYDPPRLLQRLLNLPGLRVVPFCACRTQSGEDASPSIQETTNLMNGFGETPDQNP